MEVRSAGPDVRVLTPRAAKVRVVLATLLVRVNEVVSVDSLIDELWGEQPPRTAMTTLQVYISQLRKMLRDADPEQGGELLQTRSPGYLFRLDPGQLDLTVFEDLHARGREALAAGDHTGAADLQRRALALWRGPLLSDTPHGSLLDSMAVRLTEVRTAALEQRVRAELHLGRHQELLGELRALTAELPMHEEFHAHLMVALYRTGRQADALGTFATLRRTLVDDLAIEPGRQIQQLHSRILTGDPALLRPSATSGARTAAPAKGPGLPDFPVTELPQPDPLFTGREAELAELAARLEGAPAGGCVMVSGPAGAGKTALAAAAAHRAATAFPDGRVLVRLRTGAGGRPAGAEALAAVLRAFGTTGTLPTAEDELGALLHRLTEGRRILLVLDDVASAAQLRPLLAAVPGCVVLATCRGLPRGMAALGVQALPLGPLGPAAGRSLLADDEASGELTELCGGLPLALRAVAAQLASHPRWTTATLADRLRAPDTRLSELRAADEECYGVLRAAYAEGAEADRAAFRLLGTVPAGPFGADTAAAALGSAAARAEDSLESLVEAGLLVALPEGGYRLPELLRLLAVERLAEEEPATVAHEATARLCEALAAELEAAHRARHLDGLHPLEWFERRGPELADALVRAHRAGLWPQTVRLADGMSPFLEALAAWEVWERCHTAALDAARRLGDDAAEARMLRSLGDLAWQRRRLAEAGDHYRQALRAVETAGPAASAETAPERVRALAGLVDLRLDEGALAGAAQLLDPMLDEVPQDIRGRWELSRVQGLLAVEAQVPGAAETHFRQCLTLASALGDRRLESYARRWLNRLGGGEHRADWSEVRPGVWRARATTG
ncbi:winged helix-turn-helix domain-containing protein [Streptomyces sp. ISL-43]|uniref:AfsR/SARP family transcriptional regulator n=1 Tax=Streptomyces sp. ISL-43 TaxID=2819183 RepID=UPI001BEC8EE6|nr:AfsR/SARP family transcriptional regulator [Streptomyces sp. ISL-43]MBT2446422.1 winged helix-turn-helix domain-containing protein [Streptomyces sp. ISL-43]